jgi:hypothetical protein
MEKRKKKKRKKRAGAMHTVRLVVALPSHYAWERSRVQFLMSPTLHSAKLFAKFGGFFFGESITELAQAYTQIYQCAQLHLFLHSGKGKPELFFWGGGEAGNFRATAT